MSGLTMWPPSIHRFWTEDGEVILFNIRGKLEPGLSFGFQVRAPTGLAGRFRHPKALRGFLMIPMGQ
jgi:hypothetical protein